MRDLYHQLTLPGQERNHKAIREAIEACSDVDLAAASRHILLSPKRKAIYDRNWRVMHNISCLRASLCLTRTAHWRAIDAEAFEANESTGSSELAALRENLNQPPRQNGQGRLQV